MLASDERLGAARRRCLTIKKPPRETGAAFLWPQTTTVCKEVGCTEPKANCTGPAFDGAVRLRLSAPYAIRGNDQRAPGMSALSGAAEPFRQPHSGQDYDGHRSHRYKDPSIGHRFPDQIGRRYKQQHDGHLSQFHAEIEAQ